MKLSDLRPCFEGVIPAIIGTCSKDGTPNASHISHVYQVDERHVATSFQFFNKTRANLLENPYASLHLRHPANMQPFRMKLKYLRSEDHGPVFDAMTVKLDVIAAYEGMGPTFDLKAADIYEVLEIESIEGKTTLPAAHECENVADLELARVISDKMNQATSMDELLDLSLKLLNRYLGWTHIILLLAGDKEEALLTHASLGYERGGVGSEVKWGEGLIGRCAEYKKLFQVSALQEGTRYAKAARESAPPTNGYPKIPLPGLARPASQIAAPITAHGDLLGVLALESETKPYWNPRDMLFLSILTNLLGLALNSFEGKDAQLAQAESNAKSGDSSYRFRFVEGDDLIFVNDQYLIKNTPALILRHLLSVYLESGRTEFSNMELRTERKLKLPEYKDNLETRLILLRRRLEEQQCGVRLVSTGRGKFKIEISGKIELVK